MYLAKIKSGGNNILATIPTRERKKPKSWTVPILIGFIIILSLALSGLATLYYSNILTATPDIVVINQTPDNNTSTNMIKNTSSSSGIKNTTSTTDKTDKNQKSDNSEETTDKTNGQRNST